MGNRFNQSRRSLIKAIGGIAGVSFVGSHVGSAGKSSSFEQWLKNQKELHGLITNTRIVQNDRPTVVLIEFEDGTTKEAHIYEIDKGKNYIVYVDGETFNVVVDSDDDLNLTFSGEEEEEEVRTTDISTQSAENVVIGLNGDLSERPLQSNENTIKRGAGQYLPPAAGHSDSTDTLAGASGVANPNSTMGGEVELYKYFNVLGNDGESETIQFTPTVFWKYELNALLGSKAKIGADVRIFDFTEFEEKLNHTIYYESQTNGNTEEDDGEVIDLTTTVTAGHKYKISFRANGIATCSIDEILRPATVDAAWSEGSTLLQQNNRALFVPGPLTYRWDPVDI